MRETGGRIVLMDFGAAAMFGPDSSATATVAGTPMYLAPEVLEGAPSTVSSDLYSLAVLLFYLVTGEFPVAAPSLSELRRAHAAGVRKLLRDLRPDLPSAFVRVVDNVLAAAPANRPDSAGAFEALLETSTGIGDVPAVATTVGGTGH